MATQHLSGIGDLPLTGQEDQDVTVTGRHQFVGGIADRLRLVRGLVSGAATSGRSSRHGRAIGVVQLLIVNLVQTIRAVTILDRIHPAGHLDHRRVGEMPGESLRVDGGRCDDQLGQVGRLRQQADQVAEQEIDVQAPLVRLVNDQRVVAHSLRSAAISVSSMPSVISFTSVSSLELSLNRT